MELTDSIIDYRRYLKRRNLSACTIRNYLNNLKQFLAWLKVPIELATHQEIMLLYRMVTIQKEASQDHHLPTERHPKFLQLSAL